LSLTKIAIVIPARMGSTRFPGKPLVDLAGKPMVQWVVEAARNSEVAATVLVATPDPEIVAACQSFGAQAVLTRDDHLSGTDRIGEVSEKIDAEVFINVQGDEPLIDPSTIRSCAQPLIESPEVEMSSVYCVCREEEVDNPDVVKLVTDRNGYALYFSRYAVPFPRNPRSEHVKKHIGIYGYRRKTLEAFRTWKPSPLESSESLEQLRFLENGVKIKMSPGASAGVSVDTPAHADEVRKLLLRKDRTP
jgi:3-deoxy-D-manno-octulosonate cytidylyltransferase